MGIVYRRPAFLRCPLSFDCRVPSLQEAPLQGYLLKWFIGVLLGLNRGYIGGCKVYGFPKIGVPF